MLDAMTKWIFMYLNFIMNLFTGIFINIIVHFFAPLNEMFVYVNSFLNTYVWPMVLWIRRVLVNVCCFPNDLFHWLIYWIALRLYVSTMLRMIIFIVNIWDLFKGGHSDIGAAYRSANLGWTQNQGELFY